MRDGVVEPQKVNVGAVFRGIHNNAKMKILDIGVDRYTGNLTVVILDCKTGNKFAYGYQALLQCDIEFLDGECNYE